MIQCKISEIQIGDRHRKDLGNLRSLAGSIEDIGLLQPIGITQNKDLVFGERRLAACRDILGWSEIEVRVVDIERIVIGEFAENEVRKDFTVSERVAILETIGRKPLGDQSRSENFPTADEAATKAGFGNRKTASQAREVVENGTPELVEAMDDKVVSIHAAATVAKQPEDTQRVFVRVSREEEREARRMLRNIRTPPKESALEKEVLDLQEFLMAFETVVMPPMPATRMAMAMLRGQRSKVLQSLPIVRTYLDTLEQELRKHDKDSAQQTA